MKLEEEGYDPVEFAADDYKLVYAPANPKDAGDVTVTITPKDTTKYTGTSKKSYTIKKASFEAIDAGINEISNVEYTGKDIEPEVTVRATGYDVKEGTSS